MTHSPKKYILIMCALFTCQQTLGMSASLNAYAQSAVKKATATTGRKIALALAASLICYELFRMLSLTAQEYTLDKKHSDDAGAQEAPRNGYSTLFAHGLGGSRACGTAYRSAFGYSPEKFHAFNFADADNENPRECSLAQAADIQQLKNHIDAQKDKNLVLIGLSRGASTAITTVGTHKPSNVKALIVESPFDDVKSIVAHKASYARWIPGVTTLGNIGLSFFFPKYSTCALRPIDTVTHIPDDVPVLFVCSKEDALIPASSTKALYNKLKKHRAQHKKNNVYIMETKRGPHANILYYNQEQYRQAVHAFYKKAGFPASEYNTELANQGERLLRQS